MGAPRYSGPRGPGGVRMPQGITNDFNGPPGGQPMIPNQPDSADFVGWQSGPPGMAPINPRMNPPRGPTGLGGQMGGPVGAGYGPGSGGYSTTGSGGASGMRGPTPGSNSLAPTGPPGTGATNNGNPNSVNTNVSGNGSNGGNSSVSGSAGGGPGGTPGVPGNSGLPMSGRPQWQPNTSTPMNYSSSSPGNYVGGPPGSGGGPPGPSTPIMPSPQDSSNSGGENMYTLMKAVTSGSVFLFDTVYKYSFHRNFPWEAVDLVIVAEVLLVQVDLEVDLAVQVGQWDRWEVQVLWDQVL